MERLELSLACSLKALVILLVLAWSAAEGQAQVTFDSPIVVARGTPDRSFREPHLAIHPENGDHFVAATIVPATGSSFEERTARQTCAAFVSFDRGNSWRRHDFQVTWCFDPWVVVTPDGQVLVTMQGVHDKFPQLGRSSILAFHSSDGGRTWDETPVGLGTLHDHPTMAIDVSSPRRKGWIYVLSHHTVRADDGVRRWSIWVSRSRDGGKTFDDPMNIIPNNLHNLAEMPVVLRDGTLIASFVDSSHRGDKPNGDANDVPFDRRRAWIIRSTDGADRFSSPIFVNDACGPPPGFRLSALAADTSTGPFSGRLYFACRERGAGRIVINHAADGREEWSAPVPVGQADAVAEERIPAIAVNNRGVVGVAWIDGRTAPGHRCEAAVYFASSSDGGQTFSVGQRISATEACPENTLTDATGGDYFGFAPAPNGKFELLWAETRNGVTELRRTSVLVEGSAQSVGR